IRYLTVPSGSTILKLDRVVSFLAQCLLGLVVHPVSVVWMDPLTHNFAVWETLPRIDPPDSVALLRPGPYRFYHREFLIIAYRTGPRKLTRARTLTTPGAPASCSSATPRRTFAPTVLLPGG